MDVGAKVEESLSRANRVLKAIDGLTYDKAYHTLLTSTLLFMVQVLDHCKDDEEQIVHLIAMFKKYTDDFYTAAIGMIVDDDEEDSPEMRLQ